MIGILLGLACGTVEYLLLQVLVHNVTNNTSVPFWVLPAKMAALVCFFVPCGLLVPQQLPHAGIAAAAALIIASLIKLVVDKRKKPEKPLETDAGEDAK